MSQHRRRCSPGHRAVGTERQERIVFDAPSPPVSALKDEGHFHLTGDNVCVPGRRAMDSAVQGSPLMQVRTALDAPPPPARV
jgi:hypothetical protein